MFVLWIVYINMSDLCVGELIFDIFLASNNEHETLSILIEILVYLVMRLKHLHIENIHMTLRKNKNMEQPLAAF